MTSIIDWAAANNFYYLYVVVEPPFFIHDFIILSALDFYWDCTLKVVILL